MFVAGSFVVTTDKYTHYSAYFDKFCRKMQNSRIFGFAGNTPVRQKQILCFLIYYKERLRLFWHSLNG